MKLILLMLIIGFFVGCDVFTTRTPETPDNSSAQYVPPTEPTIVIQNFESSLRTKNLENYLKCFNSGNSNLQKNYIFYPSQEANASFPSLFIGWSNEEERRFFNSLKALLGNESNPALNWVDKKAIIENPDSAVFESNYDLYINFSDNNIPKQYAGTLRFVMVNDNNGLWTISRWYDYNLNQTDTILSSFSFLKAKIYN